jgi:hypothetical protein
MLVLNLTQTIFPVSSTRFDGAVLTCPGPGQAGRRLESPRRPRRGNARHRAARPSPRWADPTVHRPPASARRPGRAPPRDARSTARQPTDRRLWGKIATQGHGTMSPASARRPLDLRAARQDRMPPRAGTAPRSRLVAVVLRVRLEIMTSQPSTADAHPRSATRARRAPQARSAVTTIKIGEHDIRRRIGASAPRVDDIHAYCRRQSRYSPARKTRRTFRRPTERWSRALNGRCRRLRKPQLQDHGTHPGRKRSLCFRD